ncbi:MAG: hypothetical protein K940chlam3_00307 [Chlamydiae bacterium]|nr:hypothetical protein [Chlamydiota bacterium]
MLKRKTNQLLAASIAFLTTAGFMGSASAAWEGCCPENSCYRSMCAGLNGELYLDFILWQTNIDGTEFARQDGDSGSVSSTVTNDGAIHDVGCSWDPGFRVGMLMNLGKCCWDFQVQYTYHYERFGESAVVTFLAPTGLDGLIYNNGNMENITAADGNWDNRLQVLDVGLGKTFEACGCFEFRPHLGIKATWQKLKYRVIYDLANLVTQNGVRDTLNFRTDFEGVGLRGGFDVAWQVCSCMRILGGVSLSSVWSELCLQRIDIRETLTGGVPSLPVINVDLKENVCVLVPVFEFNFGFRWDTCLCCRYPAFVFLGWENQVWFDLNRLILFGASTLSSNYEFGPRGNVSYQGLVVRLGSGF